MHPALARYCQNLQSIWHCVNTEDLGAPEQAHAVLILPMFGWFDVGEAVGKKNLTPEGERWLMPARLEWDIPAVSFLPVGQSLTASWTTTAPGVQRQGSVIVTALEASVTKHVQSQFEAIDPPSKQALEIARSNGNEAIDALRGSHTKAIWEITEHYLKVSEEMLENSHRKYRGEVYETRRIWHENWVDEQDRQDIINKVIFGDSTDPSESDLGRMLTRHMEPGAFHKADPMRVGSATIAFHIRETLRSLIGEPRQGSRIRAIAQSIGSTNIDEVRKECNRRLAPGGGRLSAELVSRALYPQPRATKSITPDDEDVSTKMAVRQI
ncbi:hypothetical protein GCM10025790_21830 [Nesterenkonia rhizosphaerae]|uniref:Uncharacterized protein n=1 Tax=Nesterenkonia rhizosphaerae TaxID=1348272 RepID=A0ABP9G918_9MICC